MTDSITPTSVTVLREPALSRRTFLGDASRRLLRNPLAILGLAIVLIFIGLAVFADQVAPYSPSASDLSLYVTPPSNDHLLGTDDVGRDVLSRIIYGTRISLQVSLFSTVIGLFAGVVIGLISGYFEGIVDTLMMRLTDIFLAFPLLLLAIAFVALLWVIGTTVGLFLVLIAMIRLMGVTNWRVIVTVAFVTAATVHGLLIYLLDSPLPQGYLKPVFSLLGI